MFFSKEDEKVIKISAEFAKYFIFYTHAPNVVKFGKLKQSS